MREKLFCISAICIFVILNGLIVQKEVQIRNNEVVFFELAPRDPRSIMQGDYMVLNYELQRQFGNRSKDMGDSGVAVLTLDDKKIATLTRHHKGEKLDPNERLLKYRSKMRSRRGRKHYLFASESFMFQEGKRPIFDQAKYGAFALSSSGKNILLYLADENLKKLE